MKAHLPGFIKKGSFGRPTFVSVLISYGKCGRCGSGRSIPVEFLHAFSRLQNPINSSNMLLSYKHMEIGVARCKAIHDILRMKDRPRYILWLSDDDLPPYDALIKLYMAMENNKSWDILTSLVHLKNEPPSPVLWRVGHPPMLPGKDFKPGEIVESDIANLGFGLMRPELFEELPTVPFQKMDPECIQSSEIIPQWFKSGFRVEEMEDGRDGMVMFTEDCVFFETLRKLGKKIGVHTGVRSGHLDVNSGIIY